MSRWTIRQLEEMSDLEILREMLMERKSTCTNIYSPLSKKIAELVNKLSNLIQEGRQEIK